MISGEKILQSGQTKEDKVITSMELTLEEIEKDLLLQYISTYQHLVNILLRYKGNDGVCRISQAELAREVGISPTSISVKLRRLQKVDSCIEKVGRGGAYKVNFSNLLENGPFKKVLAFYDGVYEHPELLALTYKEQAEKLQFSPYEIKMVWGFLNGAYGSPNKLVAD